MQSAEALAPTEDGARRCLTTDELLQLVVAELPEPRRSEAVSHVERCDDCQALLTEAMLAQQDSGAVLSRPFAGFFRVGDLIAGRYRIERFVARGGMGDVYAVQDETLQERIALKTLRDGPDDAKAVRRLKSEVLLSRRIGHPNTCRIFDFGEHTAAPFGPVFFFTMALIEGETLGARIRREGPLPTTLVLQIARQVLGGLAQAHGLGILHRDLKSENIMLRSPPSTGLTVDAVVMDFGLALRLDGKDRLTSDRNLLIGSAAYMAPEQIDGGTLTPATDVYALGVILFEMLTGRLPFQGPTLAAIALQRLRKAPPAPSSLKPGLDGAWDRLVLRCLERSAEDRFASARDVLAALDELSESTSRRPRRLQRAALLVTALVALIGLIFVAARASRSPTVLEPLRDRAEPVTQIAPARPPPEQPPPPTVSAQSAPVADTERASMTAPTATPAPRATSASRSHKASARKRAPAPAREARVELQRPAPAATSSEVRPTPPPAYEPLEPLPIDSELPR